ncbi:MAG: DNA polymerase III, partial [Gammaproteobacteria bacterium]
MAVTNAEIAAIFTQLADLLEVEGEENPFRIRAYRNAARVIGGLGRSLEEMVREGEDLEKIPGIGHELAAKIREIVETGRLQALEKHRRKVAPGLAELLRVPGLGPKRIRVLEERLGVRDLKALERAARNRRIRELPGFGPRVEQNILRELEALSRRTRRFLRAEVEEIAETLSTFLARQPGVGQVVVAGSYRRWKETVGDLDILVTAAAGSRVADAFVTHASVERVLSHGAKRASVVLRHTGLQVDLRVVPEESFGAALHYFTGSKAHNIAIRTLAVRKGLKVNEYGVFRGDERVAGETEESVYARVGLPWIAPELRENRGEIEAAREGRLPELIELKDLKGDLHCHTDATDGRATLE